jgi:hypothetical protein
MRLISCLSAGDALYKTISYWGGIKTLENHSLVAVKGFFYRIVRRKGKMALGAVSNNLKSFLSLSAPADASKWYRDCISISKKLS